MFCKKFLIKGVLNESLYFCKNSVKLQNFIKNKRYLCSLVSSQAVSDSSVNNTIEDKPQFPGSRSKWTDTLEFIVPEHFEGIPVYRVMDRDGFVLNPTQDPNLSQDMITKLYKGLTLNRIPHNTHVSQHLIVPAI